MNLRIYVDFNTMMADKNERVYINTTVNENITEYLYDGLSVTVYDEEMEVGAVIECEGNVWLAKPDWSTQRDLSQSIGSDAPHEKPVLYN